MSSKECSDLGGIDVSSFTGKMVKPTNNSAFGDHLPYCSYSSSLENFRFLAPHENKIYLLKIKESFLML